MNGNAHSDGDSRIHTPRPVFSIEKKNVYQSIDSLARMIVTVAMKRKTSDRLPAAVAAHIEDSERVVPLAPVWSPALRIAFRFVVLYFGLFCLATQIAGSLFMTPNGSFRGFGLLWPMRPITVWFATRFFGATEPLAYGRFSGETLFYWVQTFWVLLAAVAGTVIWSLV